MNHKIKRRWVAALRSNKYQQHFGALCNSEKSRRCALGVLADKVSMEAYFSLGYPEVSAIVNLNDRQRLSFPEIADWIEENL